MKLNQMEKDVWYIVKTNGSVLKIGDRIMRSSEDDALVCKNGGWIDKENWDGFENEVEFDTDYYKLKEYEERIRYHKDQIQKLIDKIDFINHKTMVMSLNKRES